MKILLDGKRVKKDRSRFSSWVGMTDMMFNLVVAFVFMFILAFLLINLIKIKIPPTVEREGYYVISINWDKGLDADIDLWVKAPNKEKVGFRTKTTNSMSLLRDDLGNMNDVIILPNGTKETNPLNREETGIRVPQVGKYVVNVHYWGERGLGLKPITIKAEIRRVKDGHLLMDRELVLTKGRGEEQTLFVFELDAEHNLKRYEKPTIPILWVVERPGTY